FHGQGNNNNGNRPNQNWTFGRKQPYSAYKTEMGAQNTNQPGQQPKNTFFTQNDNAVTPFTWLTHLDRPLVNQLELLHVSGFKQHELTQQFVVNGNRFQHYAPWADPASAIYRSLDLLGTPNNMLGAVRGGRWPGNINLNTITELEVFKALCDAQDVNGQPYYAFSTPEVQNILTKIIMSRTGNAAANYPPLGLPIATSDTFPNGSQKPFKSFAAGDITDTFFRPDPTNPGQPLFAVGAN